MLYVKGISALLVTFMVMAPAAHARSNYTADGHSINQDVSSDVVNTESTGIYQALKRTLGERLYGKLLENDRFLTLQELVINSIETNYPTLTKRKRNL